MTTAEHAVPFDELGQADLIVDGVYGGGARKTIADDPVAKLLPVGNSGGFRFTGTRERPALVALCSNGRDPDWPDALDPETGVYVYYGDNRTPGSGLLATSRSGNVLLTKTFDRLHGNPPWREEIAPFLVFESTGSGRDVRFLGLAVPGATEVEATDDLVAIWRTTKGLRFQNYRSTFTVLDVPRVPRAWIDDVLRGDALASTCPEAFLAWARTGRYQALRAPRTISHRSRQAQLPTDAAGLGMLRAIHERFAGQPHEFEGCAAQLWRMQYEGGMEVELTRPSVDGGRDAIGSITIGPATDPVRLDFALEAKCYAPDGGGAGVKDVARLISRLRHRQFGVFVTTSYVGQQAYKEIREDQHPVVIISGVDVLAILRRHGYSTMPDLLSWLDQDFRQLLIR